jgi:hypothetical protein
MNREEYLAVCKKCTHRKNDFNEGIVCALTQRKADFIKECVNFKLDASVKVVEPDNEEGIATEEVLQQLSPAVLEKLRSEQNLQAAIMTGIGTGLIGAVLWAVITVATEYQIGYMAVAVGFGVGYMIRMVGKGLDPIFGYLGGAIAFLSCILGNMLGIVGFVAKEEGIGYLEAVLAIDYTLMPEIMIESFSPIDLLFYGFAIYEGYKYSFRKITEEELLQLTASKN